MRRQTTKFLLILLLSFSGIAFADLKVICKPLKAKEHEKNIILPGVDQPRTTVIYFIQNIAKQSLWLDHPVQRRSASAGWSSYVQPGMWSALLVNRKDFAISCAEIQPGKVDYLHCEKVISICSPEKLAVDSKRKGSYWLTENKSWDDLLKALEKRGVKKT